MGNRDRLLQFIASHNISSYVKWINSSRNIPEIENVLERDGAGFEVN